MAINGYFFNAINDGGTYDRTYSAQDMCSYLNQIVGNGVFPNPSTQLQARAGSGMQIIVAAGQGWIDGHKIINTADFSIDIAAADALLNRIDRLIFYCDYVNREMGIEVLTGQTAVTPTAPALTRNQSRYEMSLATITVNKQVTSITNAMITDTRADSSVCGWATGVIEQVDTSTLFQQWQTAYSDYYASIKQQLDDFMETLTQELKVNTYIQEYKKYVTLTASSSKIIPLDMTGYTYEESDIMFVIINGLVGVDTVDYLLDTRGATPELHVNLVGSQNVQDEVEIRVLKSVIGIQNT